MKKIFNVHLSQTQRYEDAGPIARNILLEKTKESLKKHLTEKKHGPHALKTMTYAACFINYANALLTLESECLTMEPSLLIETAKGYYNQVESNQFCDILRECVSHDHEFPDFYGLKILQIEFIRIISAPQTNNTSLLEQLLHTINHWEPNGTAQAQQKQEAFLNSLRRRFLINTLDEALRIEKIQKMIKGHPSLNKTYPEPLLSNLKDYKSFSALQLLQEWANQSVQTTQLLSLDNNQKIEEIITIMIADIEKAQHEQSLMTSLRLKALNEELEKINTKKESYKNQDSLKPLVLLLDKFEKQIKSLASSDQEDIDQLREVAEQTYILLTSQGTPDDVSLYEDFAKSIQQGRASPGLSALGATMLVLSVTFIALGLAAMMSPLVAGIAAVTTIAASITFFATSSQQGLSKTTSNIADFVEAHPPGLQA